MYLTAGANDDQVREKFQKLDMLGFPHFLGNQLKATEDYVNAHRCPFFTAAVIERKKNQFNPMLPEYAQFYQRAYVSTTLTLALSRLCYGHVNLLLLLAIGLKWSADRDSLGRRPKGGENNG